MLSEIGLHGGNVKIVKDMKKSSNEREVPLKPSIGGVKARRFLSKITTTDQAKATKPTNVTYVSKIQYQQWRRLHNAVKDQEGASRNAKAEVWQTVDVLFQMCEKGKWTKAGQEALPGQPARSQKSILYSMDQHINNTLHGKIASDTFYFSFFFGSKKYIELITQLVCSI